MLILKLSILLIQLTNSFVSRMHITQRRISLLERRVNINELCEVGMWREAINALAIEDNIDIHGYNNVIRCCGMAGEWRACLGVLRSLMTMTSNQMQRPAPNADTFLFAGSAAARHGPRQEASSVLEQAKRKNATTIALYTVVIGAYGRAKDIMTALQLFDDLLLYHVPDTQACTAVIDACAAVGDYQNAFRIMNLMQKQFQVKPNYRTYRGLLSAASKKDNNTNNIWSIIQDAEQKIGNKKEELAICYEAALFSTGADFGEKLLSRLEMDVFNNDLQLCARTSPKSYLHLIGAWRRHGNWLKSLYTLQRFEDAANFDSNPFAYKYKRHRRMAYTHVISAAARAGETQIALSVFANLTKRIKPDVPAYNAVLLSCRMQKKFSNQALRLYQKLSRDPILKPDALSVAETIASLDLDSRYHDADHILARALASNISIRKKSNTGLLDSDSEVDLTSLPFPLARSLVRLTINKHLSSSTPPVDIIFITGVGARRTPGHTSLRSHLLEYLQLLDVRLDSPGAIRLPAQGILTFFSSSSLSKNPAIDSEKIHDNDIAPLLPSYFLESASTCFDDPLTNEIPYSSETQQQNSHIYQKKKKSLSSSSQSKKRRRSKEEENLQLSSSSSSFNNKQNKSLFSSAAVPRTSTSSSSPQHQQPSRHQHYYC